MTKEMLLEIITKAMAEYTARKNGSGLFPKIFAHCQLSVLRQLGSKLCSDGKNTVEHIVWGKKTGYLSNDDDLTLPGPNCVIVPTSNPNGHSYELNQPIMIARADWAQCVKMDGTKGNDMARRADAYRDATPEEIDTYAAAVAPHLKLQISL